MGLSTALGSHSFPKETPIFRSFYSVNVEVNNCSTIRFFLFFSFLGFCGNQDNICYLIPFIIPLKKCAFCNIIYHLELMLLQGKFLHCHTQANRLPSYIYIIDLGQNR